MKRSLIVVGLSAVFGLVACRSVGSASEAGAKPERTMTVRKSDVGVDPGGVGAGVALKAREGNELAAVAGGCFWGVEDNMRQVPGVKATAVGYTGGKTERPTYESVCSHTTGHAEAVLVEFDPKKISYEELLVVFFANHDPTTMNRQGPDVGDQYRSAVFTFDERQAKIARDVAAREEKKLGKKVTTQIAPVGAFWKAEEYHQQYDEKTGTHSCPMPKGLPKST